MCFMLSSVKYLNKSKSKITKKMSFEEDKRTLIERKRNLLYLITQYLSDIGCVQTKEMLFDECHLSQDYQVCDNIDLDTIYLEFCSYQQLKFGKIPKIIRKQQNTINGNSTTSTTGSNNNLRKSANIKQRQQQHHQTTKGTQKINETENDKLPEFESSIKVTQLNGQQNNTTAEHENNQLLNLGMILPNFDNFTTEWKEFANIICRDIIKKPFDIKWDNVHGAENAKLILKEGIILPIEYPELFNKLTKPWKSCLLHGPPGTGKTLIAKALCTETHGKVTFFNVTSSTIISKWRGESEKFIRILFEVAKIYSPSIIFIDEIESLASKRDTLTEHEASKRFKNELLTLMDGLETNINGIFILANTNLPWEIDPAFLRRFERKILIELPEFNERISIIKQYLLYASKWNKGSLDCVGELTDGYTGDELRIACKASVMMEIRKVIELNNGKNEKPIITDITHDKLVNALKQINPSSKLLIEKHLEWNTKFGNKIF